MISTVQYHNCCEVGSWFQVDVSVARPSIPRRSGRCHTIDNARKNEGGEEGGERRGSVCKLSCSVLALTSTFNILHEVNRRKK